MKRRMLWVFLVGILIGITLSGLYQHFVTDRIMDRGGMENPDYAWSMENPDYAWSDEHTDGAVPKNTGIGVIEHGIIR